VKQKTSLIDNNGTFYLRIPPALKEHLGLKVGEDTVEIEDEKKSKGVFAAFWAVVESDGKQTKKE
jgi:hypothetical protein